MAKSLRSSKLVYCGCDLGVTLKANNIFGGGQELWLRSGTENVKLAWLSSRLLWNWHKNDVLPAKGSKKAYILRQKI